MELTKTQAIFMPLKQKTCVSIVLDKKGEVLFSGNKDVLMFADFLDNYNPEVSRRIREFVRQEHLCDEHQTVYLKVGELMLEALRTKHVLIDGGSSISREKIIDYIRFSMTDKYSIYEIPSGIDSREKYLDAIRNVFPIVSPLGMDVRQMNYNQIYDTQIDWMEFQAKDSFIIWNEIKKFENKTELYAILDEYVSLKRLYEEDGRYKRSFRLLVNSNIPLDDYIQHAKSLYPSRENESSAEKLKKHIVLFHV